MPNTGTIKHRQLKTGRKTKKQVGRSPLIIHVDGLPGAGKTYICSQLSSPSVVCLDNDDIVLYAKNRVDELLGTKDEMPRTFESVGIVIQQRVTELINKYTQAGKRVILFVGVRFMVNTELNHADHRYFIKLDNLRYTFRRVFLRETEKIVENANTIKALLNDPELEEEELDDMVLRTTNLALQYPPEFDDYKGMYEHKLQLAKKNNYKVMTQTQIIDSLHKLIARLEASK